MAKWEKTARRIQANGEKTIRYEAMGISCAVESRKRKSPHENGGGYWFRTTFHAIRPDGKEMICNSLRHAKLVAELYEGSANG